MEKYSLYQIDPYTGRRRTVVRDGVAIKDYWVLDFIGNRHFVKKGTVVNEDGLPKERKENG